MTDGARNAARVIQRGCFQIDLPPTEAFKLFTAMGERLWVPGWSPRLLGPIPQQPGLVFLTGTGPDFTIWTVIESDPMAGRVCYSRVTPGSRAGIVNVEVTGVDAGSNVEVAYDLTALTADGEASLQAYSSSNFAHMLDSWKRLVAAMLVHARPALTALQV